MTRASRGRTVAFSFSPPAHSRRFCSRPCPLPVPRPRLVQRRRLRQRLRHPRLGALRGEPAGREAWLRVAPPRHRSARHRQPRHQARGHLPPRLRHLGRPALRRRPRPRPGALHQGRRPARGRQAAGGELHLRPALALLRRHLQPHAHRQQRARGRHAFAPRVGGPDAHRRQGREPRLDPLQRHPGAHGREGAGEARGRVRAPVLLEARARPTTRTAGTRPPRRSRRRVSTAPSTTSPTSSSACARRRSDAGRRARARRRSHGAAGGQASRARERT